MVQRMIAQQAQAMPRGGAPQSMVEGIAMVSMVVGLVLSLIYPILLLIFMTRQNVIEACQPEAVPPPDQA
jgi:hypothetical protein